MIPPFPATDVKSFDNAKDACDYIQRLYQRSEKIIRDAFSELLDGSRVDPAITDATYPYVGISIDAKDIHPKPHLSYGFVCDPGLYGTTVTQPDLFYNYYYSQIESLIQEHNVPVYVGSSHHHIPLPFIIDHAAAQLDEEQLWHIKHGFVLPNLSRIDDDIPNGMWSPNKRRIRPLALFEAERIDFSIQRLQHYTGTSSDHFQSFILLTNYQRYVDPFIEFAKQQIQGGDEYTELIGPGNVLMASKKKGVELTHLPLHLPQMPAYHLKRQDGQGITFINIGVGPSNAKTITDHLAVMRPHCWIMLGHCAGLRSSQVLGDYVLAHAYVREDHVLDNDLPPWIPIPAIAEVQVALQQAVLNVLKEDLYRVKDRMRTGTVVTTDNRNWELKSNELYERFRQSRAIAVDMESATLAGNGFRFRVPYGTLLCVSDKPIHGEIKLQGMANAFYKLRVEQHLIIGLETIEILRKQGPELLHSRKLRGFDEPPFR